MKIEYSSQLVLILYASLLSFSEITLSKPLLEGDVTSTYKWVIGEDVTSLREAFSKSAEVVSTPSEQRVVDVSVTPRQGNPDTSEMDVQLTKVTLTIYRETPDKKAQRLNQLLGELEKQPRSQECLIAQIAGLLSTQFDPLQTTSLTALKKQIYRLLAECLVKRDKKKETPYFSSYLLAFVCDAIAFDQTTGERYCESTNIKKLLAQVMTKQLAIVLGDIKTDIKTQGFSPEAILRLIRRAETFYQYYHTEINPFVINGLTLQPNLLSQYKTLLDIKYFLKERKHEIENRQQLLIAVQNLIKVLDNLTGNYYLITTQHKPAPLN